MNEQDLKMFECLKKNVEGRYGRFCIVVDNDIVNVYDQIIDENVHSFEFFGEELIVQLFNVLGMKAERY